jgi:hypothetical protein
MLGLFGDVADHRHLALPTAREQRAGFAEVEAGDVILLVVGLVETPSSSAAALLPAKVPIRVACWHDIRA